MELPDGHIIVQLCEVVTKILNDVSQLGNLEISTDYLRFCISNLEHLILRCNEIYDVDPVLLAVAKHAVEISSLYQVFFSLSISKCLYSNISCSALKKISICTVDLRVYTQLSSL